MTRKIRFKRRKSVLWFSRQMELVLQEKDKDPRRTGWFGLNFFWLYGRLHEECVELLTGFCRYKMMKVNITKETLIKECVDIANFAMFIAENIKEDTFD